MCSFKKHKKNTAQRPKHPFRCRKFFFLFISLFVLNKIEFFLNENRVDEILLILMTTATETLEHLKILHLFIIKPFK